jgi:Zn finger protein HypA/HybF involved in hydrogenase expression
MHDAVIAKSILKDLEKYGKVKKAYLEVGELFGIDPKHLLEHLKEVSDIKFVAEQADSLVECSCGYKGRANITMRMHDIVMYDCPKCGSSVKVIKGDKIMIKKVEK